MLSFRQVYINVERRARSAGPDARQVLAKLGAGADPDTLGDPTLLEPEVPLSPLGDIRRQFGDEFGKNLLEIEPGRWAGPVRSGFGLHLVFVKERREPSLPGLNAVREMVKQDWLAEKQKDLKDAAYAKIRERYTVIVEKPKIAAPLAAAANRAMVAR